MLTLTGWENAIKAHPDAQELSKGQRQRMALRIQQRAINLQHVDVDDLLRSVLCYSDPTGEQAVRNLTKEVTA